jgi:glycosyltransferase involved in cell wall biosynthesis
LVSQAFMGRIASEAGFGGGRRTPGQLRSLSDQARARRDWSADVHYRRQLVRQEPEKPGAWVQYGHALKEAGFHADAEKAYLKALDLKPDDAEINLQLGHLAKVRGHFDEARRRLELARDLGHPDIDHVLFELKLLRRVDNAVVFHETSPHAEQTPLRVFLSVPGGPVSEGNKAAVASGLGRADYSYSFAMRGFVDALDEMEIDYTVLTNPEFVCDITQRSNAEINLHLSFYPPERIRLLKGAYNVNCFAWEFDRLRLPSEVVSYHAFADQATMLDLADEIWVPSEHGAEAVRQSARIPVKTVAAPVLHHLTRAPRKRPPTAGEVARSARSLQDVVWEPLAVLPRIQPQMNQGAESRRSSALAVLGRNVEERPPVVFMSVFNAHDFRKQIGPMLEGFLKLAATHPEAILLLKMTTPDMGNTINDIVLKEQILNEARMIPPMISERIWITKQVLTRDELNRLYDMSSYYLCTSYAEGQNLPLIEAMGRGVVPVSVDHTAMAGYISEANAVVIPSEKKPFDRRLTNRYGLFGLETHFVSPVAVRDSAVRALELSDDAYAGLSSAAQATVREQFGLERFAAAFSGFVEGLTQSRKAAA